MKRDKPNSVKLNDSNRRFSLRADYAQLKAEIQELHRQGVIPKTPNLEQKIDWAYWNAVLSNPDVTREMVERAVNEAEE